MLRRILATLLSFIATNVIAGYAARDAWIPVAGHVEAGARAFYTTVYLTDISHSTNDVTLSFYASAQPHVPARQTKLQLGPNQTGAIDIGPQLVGDAGATGALHVHGSAPLIASARIFGRGEVGGVLNAIPSQYAIGTHESAVLHVPSGARYKVYAVETHGFPLYFSVMAGPGRNERRLFLSANEQRSWDLAELFGDMHASSVRLTGISGSGKIIVAGTSNSTTSSDFAAFEMSLPSEPRHQLRWPELIAYIAVALAIIAAGLKSRSRGPRPEARGRR